MKKFLFTLAAVLMSMSVFAQTDAKYLYVNTALCADDGVYAGVHYYKLVISAEFPGYLNAFEAFLDLPEGMTIQEAPEAGPDSKITWYNARGVEQTPFTPAISWAQSNPTKFVIAIAQQGYDYVDGVLTDVTALKWAPGYHEQFMIAYVVIDDETYHGGDVVITTIPSSGADPRTTIDDLGDKSVPHTTHATEPLPDPNPAATKWADPVVVVDDAVSADGFLYATITWEEGGDLYINGEKVEGVTSPYRYKIAAQALYDQEGSFFCQVKGGDLEDSENVRTAWTLPAREATYVPAPTLTWDESTYTMTVTVPEGYSVVVTGPNGTETITETKDYVITPTYSAQSGTFSAYTVKKTEDYNSQTVTKPYSVDALPTTPSATPVISVVDNEDGTYTISAEPTATTTMMDGDGNELDNPYTVSQPGIGQEDLVIFVTATNDEGEGHTPTSATQRVVIPAKQKANVLAPTHEITMDANNVYVTITWPESDGDKVYTGQEIYPRPAYGEANESYDVEAYVTAGPTCNESAHDAFTVTVPAKDPEWQNVTDPVISYETTATQVIVTVTWPETTGDKVYTGQYVYDRPAYGQPNESYDVTAYTTENYPYRASGVAEATIPVPAQDPVWQDVAAPVITTDMDANYVYVDIDWPETTGEQYYNGQAYYERGDADYEVTVEAYTGEKYPYRASEPASLTFTVPAKEQVAMKTYVKVTALDQLVAGKKYIFVAADYAMGEIVGGFGTPVELTAAKAADEVKAPENIAFTLGGETGAWTFEQNGQYLLGTNSTSLAMGEDGNAAKWNINNNNGALNGYRARNAQYDTRSVKKHNTMPRFGNYANSDTNSEYALIYVEKEDEPVLEPTMAPGVETWSGVNGDHTQYVKFNESEDNCELEYRVKYEDGEWSDWTPYNGTLSYTENGHYEVEGRAKAEGKDWSEATGVTFVVSPATGFEEVNGDKAIAGVRYFNLAGQEMAQPEGMTIIVTTYTDGTTSAVKVMK